LFAFYGEMGNYWATTPTMRKKISPAKTSTPYTPWKIDLPKSLTGTRRVRKFFATKEDAEGYLARVRMHGFDGADKQKQPGTGMSVTELCAMFLGHFEARVGSVTFRGLRHLVGRLDARFGSRGIDSISHREIESWLIADFREGASRFNGWRVTRRVFQFAVDWLEVLDRNPMRKIARPTAKAEGAQIKILTPDQFQAAVSCAQDWPEPRRSRWLAYLALGGLAGLRTAEILSVRWEDIGAVEIYVRQPKRVRGWQPRYVKILPRFAVLWSTIKKPVRTRGHGFDLNVENPVAGGSRYLHLMRHDAVKALGWEEWPSNCLRHSFATYHLAHFKNLAALRGELGHESESVTRRHYATAARGVDAAAWWVI
jgi:integrase